MKITHSKLLVAALMTVGLSQAYAASETDADANTVYGAGSPTSSLSPNANTPRANPNGYSLTDTVVAFGRTQVGSAPAPANSGAINPNNSGTITLNPGVPN